MKSPEAREHYQAKIANTTDDVSFLFCMGNFTAPRPGKKAL